jgi:hypothetical protein
MKGLSECSAQVDPTYKKMIEQQHDMSIMPVSAQPGRHREGMAHRVAMKGERQVGIQPTEFDRHCAQEYSTQKGWHRECKRRENYSNSRATIRVWTSTQIFTAEKGGMFRCCCKTNTTTSGRTNLQLLKGTTVADGYWRNWV